MKCRIAGLISYVDDNVMQPLKADNILGNWATLLVPFGSSGAIDHEALKAELDYLTSGHLNGIYSHGTAGEFYALSEQEFDMINNLLAEKCEKADIPYQIGVSHSSAQISLERLQRAAQLDPGAVQVVLPDWFPVTIPEAIGFLDKMASIAGNIGMVLYNPPHAKKILKPEEWAVLKKAVPSLVGVKVFDYDGDDNWYKKARRYGEGLSIFVPGHNLATGIRKGAHGAYSNVACLSPFGAQHWYDLMQSAPEDALRVEKKIHRFFSDHITPLITRDKYSNPAVDKLLAAIGGWTDLSTRMRWPYRGIPEKRAKSLRPIARTSLPGFFFDPQYQFNH